MVFHKELTPADGERGIKMNTRRLVLTKVVLEQKNTAAALLIKLADGRWSPLEFLDSEHSRTGSINLTVEPGETVLLKCRQEQYFGKQYTAVTCICRNSCFCKGTPIGGQVRLHLYGNITEPTAVEPDAKRARHGASDEEVFHEGRAGTLRQ